MAARIRTRLRGHPARPRRLAAIVGLAVTGALVCGCSAAAANSPPTWVPQHTPSPIALPGQVPDGNGSSSSAPSPSAGSATTPAPQEPASPPAPAPPTRSGPAIDPNVVATRLAAPTGLVVLPDGTALVGERATGRIVQVQPTPGKPVTLVRTLSGLDASGSGGLLDLALSATYGEDGLILALITTRTDVRVVHFTLKGVVTPILTGIPRARIGNAGRLMVRPDGTVFVGTSGAGSAALAADPKSLAGKVLRIDDVGQPAPGNPLPGSPVLTAGHAHVDGLCAGPSGAVYEVEADATDQINYLSAGTRYGAGGAPPISRPSVTKGISDCAVVGSTLYVTGLGGKGLFSATITTPTKLGPFTGQLQGRYGRLRTVVAATDGTLWLTTSNLDGHGTPVPDDERVLHIRPARGGGPSPV